MLRIGCTHFYGARPDFTVTYIFLGVSLLTGFCYAINILMGSGFLVIPAGMASLGITGGTVVLLFAAGVMGITVGYEVVIPHLEQYRLANRKMSRMIFDSEHSILTRGSSHGPH